MIARTMFGICVLSVIGAAGCGSDDPKAAAEPTCPTGTGTILFTIADVSPAVGATVPNQAIMEKFTIKNAPARPASFSMGILPTHTAGLPNPNNATINVTALGDDLIYWTTVDSWTTAPGHVDIVMSSRYQADDGCIYGFPAPMFSYDVVPATGAAPSDAGAD
jgi:hypothetical protein